MKIPNNQRRQTILPIIFAAIILLSASILAFSQNNQKFKVGDRVDCDGSKGTIVEFTENEMFNGYKPDSGY